MSPVGDLQVGARVAIVSANQETLDDLGGYLRGVGIESVCARHLAVVGRLGPNTVAVVLFPDDFVCKKVFATLSALAKAAPSVVALLVTSEPRRYERALPDDHRVVILARPVWAWTIYDAIRLPLAAAATSRRRQTTR